MLKNVPLIIVLNKIDLIAKEKQKIKINKFTEALNKILDKTRFKIFDNCIIPVSATAKLNLDLLKQSMIDISLK
jgi:translation initiation factor 2 gamma subunit (eIF-2gamma)